MRNSFLRARNALNGLLFVVLFFSLSQAQETKFRVVDVEVIGNRIATTSLILGVCAIDKGSPVTSAKVQETIKRLYGLGMFADVTINAEEVSGGIKVIISVKELPKLTALEFHGNNELKSQALKDKLKIGVGGYISPFLITEKKEEIRKLYAEKGFFRATIEPKLTFSTDSTEALLDFVITERSKVKVNQVIMTGNKRVLAKDLIGKMRNRKRGFLRSSTFAEDKYEEDLEKIATEFHKRGFIDAYVKSDSNNIDTNLNLMTIYIDVFEGPLYYFGKTEFKGNEKIKTEGLSASMKYKEGEIFDADKYDKSLMNTYVAYQEIGYLHTQIDDQRTTRSDSIIDISYDITEGLPSHINMVRIVGNTKTKEKVIRREIISFPGDQYQRSFVERSMREVMALNFFTNVEPSPIPLPNGDVDLEYKVTEKPTGQVSAGAGYNSTDKLVGTLGLGIPNFGGNGQNISLNLERGNNRNSFSLSFTEPWLFGRPTLLGVDIYTTNRRWFDEYTEGRRGGSIRMGRRLKWPDNYFRLYASYLLEQNRLHDFDTTFIQDNSYQTISYLDDGDKTLNTSSDTYLDTQYGDVYPTSIILEQGRWRKASRFSLVITRDSRNLPEFATKGSLFSYTFENTGGVIGGYWKYQKHMFEYSKFVPLFWKAALATKVQYGIITSPAGDNRIQLSDRFTPGGTAYDGIVRGYDDGTLTPDSVVTKSDVINLYADTSKTQLISSISSSGTRTRIYGKYMLVSNVELQIPIISNQIYSMLFFDMGNSWLSPREIKGIGCLYKSVGVGFRVVVPGIGTIGFDFGYPLVKKTGQDKKWKPHFQMGTTFR
jgi:outer membrane protein insertion porin family